MRFYKTEYLYVAISLDKDAWESLYVFSSKLLWSPCTAQINLAEALLFFA